MIAQALKHDGPALVEVLVPRQELSMPPTITLEQAKGFSLFMMKAVLSGRGDEVIDLGAGQSLPLIKADPCQTPRLSNRKERILEWPL